MSPAPAIIAQQQPNNALLSHLAWRLATTGITALLESEHFRPPRRRDTARLLRNKQIMLTCCAAAPWAVRRMMLTLAESHPKINQPNRHQERLADNRPAVATAWASTRCRHRISALDASNWPA